MVEIIHKNQAGVNIKQYLIALCSGFIFGLGLSLSQMIDRQRVLGFLDIWGDWDSTLLFVLAGAVTTTLVTFRFVLRMHHPLLVANFSLPTKTIIDRQLILGAIIFGIGWGISGYCPGPALTSILSGSGNPILFIAAFIFGSLLQSLYIKPKSRS
jgi:uncharacterized membrane protein YedE/YeeE